MEIQLLKSRERVVPGLEKSVPVLLKIKAPSLYKSSFIRVPIHLALVIDTSSSMLGNKIKKTIEAVKYIVSILTRHDFLTVITYNDSIQTIFENEPCVDKEYIKRIVESIQVGGSTNLSGGWIAGLTSVQEHFVSGNIHRLIVLTDGIANEGITDETQLLEISKNFLQQGIITTTMGFGEDFNERLLTNVATHGGGRFYYIPVDQELIHSFHEEFGDMGSVVAQNLSLIIHTDEPFQLGNTYHESKQDAPVRGDKFLLGDIRSDEVKQFLFDITLPDSYVNGTFPFVTVNLSFFALGSDMGIKAKEATTFIELVETFGEIDTPNEEVLQEIWLFSSGSKKIDALDRSSTGDYTSAIELISDHLQQLEHFKSTNERIGLEVHRLDELLHLLQQKNINTAFKKKVVHSVQSQFSGSGEYQKTFLHSLEMDIPVKESERLHELITRCADLIRSDDWPDDRITDAQLVLHELISNGLQHGCSGGKGTVKVGIYVAKEYLKITVSDTGSGFDYKRVLQEAKKEIPPSQDHRRGLHMVLKLAYRINYYDLGRSVEAIIQKNPLKMETALIDSLDYINIALYDNVVYVKLSGFIDLYNAGRIHEQLMRLVEDQGWANFIFDIDDLEYLDSSGIGIFLRFYGKLRKINGTMVLVMMKPPSAVKKTFEISGLTKFFHFVPSVEEALRYFA